VPIVLPKASIDNDNPSIMPMVQTPP
jgi:hypothetical protein